MGSRMSRSLRWTATLLALTAATMLPAAAQAATTSPVFDPASEPLTVTDDPAVRGSLTSTPGTSSATVTTSMSADGCDEGDFTVQETPLHIYVYECRGGRWVVVLIGHKGHPPEQPGRL